MKIKKRGCLNIERKRKSRAQIDEIMKYLFSVSKETLINMLNSLFKQNFNIDDATIIQTNSEFVDDNFDITRGDLFFRVISESKPNNLHIELETRYNGDMTIRLLEYDIKKADENQRLENNRSIKRYILPKSIVIHVEKNTGIPDFYAAEIVDFKSDGSEEIIHRVVPVIKYWELTHEDLVEQKLYPLLPLQIFLLRSELKKYAGEKDSVKKREVIEQIKKLTEKIIIEVHNLTQKEKINNGDDDKIVAALDKLIKYLNNNYNFDENLNQEVDIVMTSLYTKVKERAHRDAQREVEQKLKKEKQKYEKEIKKYEMEIKKYEMEAKTEAAIELAEKMILKDKPLAEIIEFSGLSENKIRQTAKRLSKKLVL